MAYTSQWCWSNIEPMRPKWPDQWPVICLKNKAVWILVVRDVFYRIFQYFLFGTFFFCISIAQPVPWMQQIISMISALYIAPVLRRPLANFRHTPFYPYIMRILIQDLKSRNFYLSITCIACCQTTFPYLYFSFLHREYFCGGIASPHQFMTTLHLVLWKFWRPRDDHVSATGTGHTPERYFMWLGRAATTRARKSEMSPEEVQRPPEVHEFLGGCGIHKGEHGSVAIPKGATQEGASFQTYDPGHILIMCSQDIDHVLHSSVFNFC